MLAILGAVSPHSKSDNGEIWREGTDPRHPYPALNLVEITGGFAPYGKTFTKNRNFRDF